MTRAATLILIALLGAPFATLAADAPKLSCIKDITYSQEFLTRYPKAGAACREVVRMNGQKWARFDADVVEVKGDVVTANFIDEFKQSVATLTFKAAPAARVTIDGKEAKFSELQKGDTLSFWMPERRMGFYAAPGASEGQKLALVSEAPQKR